MDKTIVHNGIARKCSLGAGVALLFLVSLSAGDGVSFKETWGWICGGILCGFAAIHPISKVYERSVQKYGEYWWFKVMVWLVSMAFALVLAIISIIWRILRGDGSEPYDDHRAPGSVFKEPLHPTDAVYDQSHDVYYGNEPPR
ncbi:MAG: hypothetical protein ABJM11_17575 [Marinobacter sp.]|uniref:Uncharacterized protein n=1 Tax=Marinobacter aromaticivorans TaxID=1494078 RepID=A0ABW2IZ36_9GAMM|nr:hypothetical protein [Marinobacter aromaticivorans]GGE77648.1 hypothetical protein GCM10011533_32460 [Streptosporangium jomthongense]